MGSLTQPLRDEHAELRPRIEALRAAADSVGVAPAAEVAEAVARCHEFLADHLLAHAHAEEASLYPAVEEAMGCPGATQTMKLDHAEIGRLVEMLGGLRGRLQAGPLNRGGELELRRVLYGLYALVMLHLQKEEDAYLPVLDGWLTAPRATAMFEAMHAAASEAARRPRTT